MNKHLLKEKFNVLYEAKASSMSFEELPTSIAKIVKHADPSVWPILSSMQEIIEAVKLQWQNIAKNVGIITMGTSYPKKYSLKIANEIQEYGRVSPLSFINANAGAAISICCTTYKFHGPTINLTMADPFREKVAATLINSWLSKGDAKCIFLVTTEMNDKNECFVINQLITKTDF